MAAKREVPAKSGQSGRFPAEAAEELEPLTPEAQEALRLRVEHMFQPHAGDPLMKRLEETVVQLLAEGRIRG